MKPSLLLTLLSLLAAPLFAAETNAPFRQLVLRDQFDRQHWFEAGSNAVTVITVADRKGSEQVEGWVRAIKTRYAERVVQLGVADVSAVPSPMRAMIRKKFAEQYSATPVLLDWKGEVTKLFPAQSGVVNVLVVSRSGGLMKTLVGPVSDDGLARLHQAIAPLLPALPAPKP
jgi:hypothetical protein